MLSIIILSFNNIEATIHTINNVYAKSNKCEILVLAPCNWNSNITNVFEGTSIILAEDLPDALKKCNGEYCLVIKAGTLLSSRVVNLHFPDEVEIMFDSHALIYKGEKCIKKDIRTGLFHLATNYIVDFQYALFKTRTLFDIVTKHDINESNIHGIILLAVYSNYKYAVIETNLIHKATKINKADLHHIQSNFLETRNRLIPHRIMADLEKMDNDILKISNLLRPYSGLKKKIIALNKKIATMVHISLR